jgi:hypothetical protein
MRVSRIIFLALIAAIIGIQFIEIEKSNPPVTGDLQASVEVKSILKEACYDCHSNETKWPWYSKVAPVSFLIVNHVNEGREHLNFSSWTKMFSQKQQEAKEEIWEEIEKDEMPLDNYTLLHPKAKLTIEQKKTIKDWALGVKY